MTDCKKTHEDEKRKAFILQAILFGMIGLALVATITNFILKTPNHDLISELVPGILLLFLIVLYVTSKRVSYRWAAVALISLLSFLSYYLAYRWGTVIPNSWMGLVLTVVMGGILISSGFSIALIVVHSAVMFGLTYLQVEEVISYLNWDINPNLGVMWVRVVILGVIAVISWLSNREIEKALLRARNSEKALQKERDLLEITVQKRTEELRQVQMERMVEFYRFADFGRMAAGVFHDMSHPATTLSLNLEQLSANNKSTTIKRATMAAKRIERFIRLVRKQVQNQSIEKTYRLDLELKDVLKMLANKAQASRVKVMMEAKPIKMFGNPLRFNQVMVNLIFNAIDAYEKVRCKKNRQVIVSLKQKEGVARIEVEDFGCGINAKDLKKIFEPFFTTKKVEKGTGIGLSICKEIIEKELEGKISVESVRNKGTIFTVEFPLKKS